MDHQRRVPTKESYEIDQNSYQGEGKLFQKRVDPTKGKKV